MKRFLFAALAIAAAACGGDEVPSAPEAPDVVGRFEGRLAVNVFRFGSLAALATAAIPNGFSCQAALDVTRQIGERFECDVALTEESDGCSAGPLFLCDGTVDEDGSVILQWDWSTLCDSTSGDPALYGTSDGRLLSVSGSFVCDAEDFTMSFDGARD